MAPATRKGEEEVTASEAKRQKVGDDADAGKQVDAKPAEDAAPSIPSPAAPTGPVLSEHILSAESRAALKAAYQSAEPYLHGVLRDVFQPDVLRAVRDEIVDNIQATYKETDLFKVFQTGDLGNLDKLDADTAAKLPTVARLKSTLYSQEFRSFVREITGCGELSDKIDCSCNVYAHGGHLLTHDDVIGTRRVSWIIYLTDPDEPWTAEDGGALELYPLVEDKPHTPETSPSVCHLPTFNTMAMFTVLPGKSFHAVQEVFTADKPRMSISGWYHAPVQPDDIDKASLQQLQLKAGEDAVRHYTPFPGVTLPAAQSTDPAAPAEVAAADPAAPLATAGDLTDDDLSLLVRYVNPAYLDESAWPKIQAQFEKAGSVQLQDFLKRSLAQAIATATLADDAADGVGAGKIPAYRAGERDGWQPVGPPHKQRYLRYSGPAAATSTTAGPLLAQVRDQLFTSPAFARLLRKFTTITMLGHTSEIRRFRAGLDYTVAHYGILTTEPRLDAVLCFVDDGSAIIPAGKGQGQEAAGAWEDGEVGGFEAYLLADDDKEGAAAEEVYRVDKEESGVLNVSAAANSLNLVLRDEGLMKFVKFVSYAAPSSRFDIAMEYLPEDDGSDEEEEEQEEAKGAEGEQA